MQIKDFERLFKYKLIVPGFYIVSWVLFLLGPTFFSKAYFHFSVFLQLYMVVKGFNMFLGGVVGSYKVWRLFKKVEEAQQNIYLQVQETCKQVLHFFILPSYKEPYEVIDKTLSRLAAHSRARDQYYIFLAMEDIDPQSITTPQKLLGKYAADFRHIGYTRHALQQHQQRGKASNVSWCAQKLAAFFANQGISKDNVFLTIIDIDSWVPQLYVEEMEAYLNKNWDNRYRAIFQPPQIFTLNHLDVPIFTRVSDVILGYVQFLHLFSFIDTSFPLSNYTLSYNLIEKVGFWDTCADAIGEDFHTTQKCIWKTNGDVICVPIYTPFNQLNIQTGRGYFSDVCARFWQAERHGQGVADVAYSLNQFLERPFNFRSFYAFLFVCECFIIPPLFSTTFYAMSTEFNFIVDLKENDENLRTNFIIPWLTTIVTILITTPYPLYEFVKRKANKILYNGQNESIFRIFEYFLIYPIVLIFILLPTLAISAFRVLIENRKYVVAEKNIVKQ